jgi:hypothetical protein
MKNLIIIIVVLGIVSFGLYYFTMPSSTSSGASPLVPSGASGGGGTFSGRDFLRTLANLQSLKLDDGIFTATVFSSLVDFSVPIQPQPKGRNNPFEPVGVE